MTTREEAEDALALIELPGWGRYTTFGYAELDGKIQVRVIRARLAELEAENERLLGEMEETACAKCDGVNGVWVEGGAWVKCPRCGEG